jgi:hypothetical protein
VFYYELRGFHGIENLDVCILGLCAMWVLEILTNVSKELTASIFRVEVSRLVNRQLYSKNGVISPGNRIRLSQPRDEESPEQVSRIKGHRWL